MLPRAGRRDAPNAERGIGLIELIVGIGLIAVAVLGLNSLTTALIRGHLSARLNDEATRLAQSKLEQVYHDGFDAAQLGSSIELVGQVKDSKVIFKRGTVIENGPLPAMRTITVTMAWNDAGSRHSVFLTEIVR